MKTDLPKLAGQVLVAGFPAGPPPEALLKRAEKGELGGIILFKRNIESPAEVMELLRGFHERSPAEAPLLIAVDQEGGRVARFGPPLLRLPPMRELASKMDPSLTRRAGEALGRQLAALGFTMNMAPVLDVDTNPNNPIIGDRSFGATAEEVVEQAYPFAEGLHAGGLLSCGKHFPGHGDTDVDSHLALPRLPHARERLDRVELPPFAAAKGKLHSLMTAHVVFEALDPGIPATLSRRVVQGLLREELGYDGVIISDDLEMKAVSERWGVVEAGLLAIEAGCDVLLVCSDVERCLALHEALIRRAEKDTSFAARLEDAASRSLKMRRLRPPRPLRDATELDTQIREFSSPQLERELGTLP